MLYVEGQGFALKYTAQVAHTDAGSTDSMVARGTYLLHVDLNVLLQIVAVQIEDQVVDKVKSVAHDDERKLISQFRFLHVIKIQMSRL